MSDRRKQLLVAALGLMLLVYAGDWLRTNLLQGPIDARNAETRRLEAEIAKREKEVRAAMALGKTLAEYEAQSLPADPEVSRSLYRGWLTELVTYAGLTGVNVDSGEPTNRQGLFRSIQFSVRGRGTLEQLTLLLYEFYSAAHLHQIRALTLTPLERGDQMDLALSIEALILAGADRKDQLAQSRSARLARARFEDYLPVVRRNFFGVGGSPDPTDFTWLTAVSSVDGQPQAWFTLRSEDRVLKLREGESLDVGQFHGTIAAIDDADVILQSEGERWLMTIGENLSQAFALPPEY